MRHVLILGAGFAGLELATRLSASLADELRITLVDRNGSFVFGFSKLEILFGRRTRQQVSCPYRDIRLPGVDSARNGSPRSTRRPVAWSPTAAPTSPTCWWWR
jgi:NADPH-dependent 2,4-dienoyl-CoA reductase/sulfur reductase-like enzyme